MHYHITHPSPTTLFLFNTSHTYISSRPSSPHSLTPFDSFLARSIYILKNHQEQQQARSTTHIVVMDSHQNPNLENNQNNNHYNVLPSQDLKIGHHQHNLKVSKDMDKIEEVCSLKNASEVTWKPNPLSCSSQEVENDTTPPQPPLTPQDFMSIHHQQNLYDPNKPHEDDGSISNNAYYGMTKKPNSPSCSSLEAKEKDMTTQEMVVDEESGREKLKKHRAEMAGRVWIPDIWGHEDLLKDWIDCTVFDSSLGNKNIMSARAALVQEGRSSLRIQNQC